MSQETYICSQFSRVLKPIQDETILDKNPYFTIRMKVQSDLGATNWINVPISKFREIECLLATE